MFTASIFTLYPQMFPGPLSHSLAGDALTRELWSLHTHNIRAFGEGRHKVVDDRPAGGGAGMVLRADIVAASLDAHCASDDPRPRLLMSPRGVPLTQHMVRSYAEGPGLIIVCGRFEGVDERVITARGLTEVSVGDYILSGGEMAALTLLDACVRLLPGVMGKEASGLEESFETGLLEYPHYTRPRTWEGQDIPPVLLSGHHEEIAAWRKSQAQALTRLRRPDLWSAWQKERGGGVK
jgi:tRNA (guanine37-N1)-methyltransferase